ncbi:MAG: 30S ribosomal protein S8e [Nanoarchaeota archaeon]
MKQGRKISGGKYHSRRKTRLHERLGRITAPTLGEKKKKVFRIRSGFIRTGLASENKVNIQISGKSKRAEITNVQETPQNKFLARQNRLAKGVIIETSLGKARITNRPSREGVINAILLESSKK